MNQLDQESVAEPSPTVGAGELTGDRTQRQHLFEWRRWLWFAPLAAIPIPATLHWIALYLFTLATQGRWIHNADHSFAGKPEDIQLIVLAPLRWPIYFLIFTCLLGAFLLKTGRLRAPQQTAVFLLGSILLFAHSVGCTYMTWDLVGLLSDDLYAGSGQAMTWERMGAEFGLSVLDYLLAAAWIGLAALMMVTGRKRKTPS